MNKRQRKKQLKKKLGAEGYKRLEKRVDDIFRAFAYELAESTIRWAEDLCKQND